MDRSFYLELAASGLCMPIGTDLVLHEHGDARQIMVDGERLGRVLEEAAGRYRTPLAVPQMDLMLEKADMLGLLGVPVEQVDTYHFSQCPTEEAVERLEGELHAPFNIRMKANLGAIRYIASRTKLVPVGMMIGPVSLMTKLLEDPITPIYVAGTGTSAEEDEEVRMVERVLEMATRVCLRSIKAQIDAGAKAICVAEPAANKAYFSPIQIEGGSDIFDRYVMKANRRIKELMDKHKVDLLFHCCGELVEAMLRSFTTLDPAMMSLGSSRKLWEDARLVPKTTVLYGNLPSKKFYSDDVITTQQVEADARKLLEKMREAGHPFVLGTECDVLDVPGCEATIRAKVAAMMRAGGRGELSSSQ